MPLADYLDDPAPEPSLSSSIAHVLLEQSPQHAWFQHRRLNPTAQREESSKMDIGTIAHGILLEGDTSRVEVIEAEDWRTKAAKEARDAARLLGKVPVLAYQMHEINAMVHRAQIAIKDSEIASAFADGKPEQTVVWQEGDIWLRSRPDWLTSDSRLILDYKTTSGSSEPSAWMRGPMLSNGCDLQAALALRGVQAVLKPRDCAFVFLVQETELPYAMSFVGMSPAFLDLAEKKLARAIQAWTDCMFTNTWPGYPSRVAWVDPPAWIRSEEESKV